MRQYGPRVSLPTVAFVVGLLFGMSVALPLWAETKPVPRDLGKATMQVVAFDQNLAAGTIVISNSERTLLRVLGGGKAERYAISVGRPGFTWTGEAVVGRKAEWPEWRPPSAMLTRDPTLPALVPPGPYNPLGARALYLYAGGADTLYRIHGTNSAGTIGGFETSGCFRLSNADAIDLYERVRVGTRVIVID